MMSPAGVQIPENDVGRNEIDKYSDANVELRNRYFFLSTLKTLDVLS